LGTWFELGMAHTRAPILPPPKVGRSPFLPGVEGDLGGF